MPESISLCLRARRCRSSSRLRENRRTNLARNLIASWVRMSLPCSSEGRFEKAIPADSPLDPSSCSTTHPPLTLVFSADMRIVSDETEPREEFPRIVWVRAGSTAPTSEPPCAKASEPGFRSMLRSHQWLRPRMMGLHLHAAVASPHSIQNLIPRKR